MEKARWRRVEQTHTSGSWMGVVELWQLWWQCTSSATWASSGWPTPSALARLRTSRKEGDEDPSELNGTSLTDLRFLSSEAEAPIGR